MLSIEEIIIVMAWYTIPVLTIIILPALVIIVWAFMNQKIKLMEKEK